jgi:hypothetical protein
LAHAANMKETYESMKLMLKKIKYDEFKWKLCDDLNVVAMLLGMQLGTQKTAVSCANGTARTRITI